eukprot:TRINITY_DN672_c0_g1_i7.p2 TRINITY_DN672_c0_g1~~TRINITY_DN672_c0_g1_i7.p2  ORF type:complete len:108 (+),score=33.12 TRINITY_DN672_c0_g1_i7:156-479(+)
MRFFQVIVLFALFSCVFTERFEREEKGGGKEFRAPKIFSEVQKYFHKKMCYCIKERGGLCTSLKCCDIFQYVPYKAFIKLCKYGDCKYVEKKEKPVTLPEKIAGTSA